MDNTQTIFPNIQEIQHALNITIMDIDGFVKQHGLLPVTTYQTFESTNNFHPEGLFSEIIFGEVNSPERYTKLGYIDIHAKILHPYIYNKLIQINSLFKRIIDCTTYVTFDPKTKMFKQSDPDEVNSNTGLTYLAKYADQLNLKPLLKDAQSDTRYNTLKLLIKYQKNWFITKFLVIPAGIRDLRKDQVKPTKDDINNKYLTILALSKNFDNIPESELLSPIYNTILFSLQTKIQEVFNYLFNMINGKYGLLQRKFATRNIALTSRNVVSMMTIKSNSPDSPDYLKSDEVQVPMIEVLKDYEPIIIHHFIRYVNAATGIQSSRNINVIDPKSLKSTTIEISIKEQEKFITPDKITTIINSFLDINFRKKPITIRSTGKKEYPIQIVYDDKKKDILYITDSVDILKSHIPNIDMLEIRPLTYYELFYMICIKTIMDKTVSTVRYPVTNKWNHNEGYTKLSSTEPYRNIRVYFVYGSNESISNNALNNNLSKQGLLNEYYNTFIDNQSIVQKVVNSVTSGNIFKSKGIDILEKNKHMTVLLKNGMVGFEYYTFPDIYKGKPVDSIILPICFSKPMNYDVDGDMTGQYSVLSNEGNHEVRQMLNNVSRYVLPSMRLSIPPHELSSQILSYITA